MRAICAHVCAYIDVTICTLDTFTKVWYIAKAAAMQRYGSLYLSLDNDAILLVLLATKSDQNLPNFRVGSRLSALALPHALST